MMSLILSWTNYIDKVSFFIKFGLKKKKLKMIKK